MPSVADRRPIGTPLVPADEPLAVSPSIDGRARLFRPTITTKIVNSVREFRPYALPFCSWGLVNPTLKVNPDLPGHMPQVTLDDETVARLDDLRIDDETYDQLINELINIYEATELSLAHGGDEYV